MAQNKQSLRDLIGFGLIGVVNGFHAEALAGDLALDASYPTFLRIDPAGANRDITLDPEADAEDAIRLIANSADAAEDLVVKDDAGATIATINRDEGAILYCDGEAWNLVILFTAPAA